MTPFNKQFWSTRKLRVYCAVLWAGIMAATLWPFNPRPRNDVKWLVGANGIHFGKNGIAATAGDFDNLSPLWEHPCSLEILLRAGNETDVSTMLGFYEVNRSTGLRLRQYVDGLLIFHDVQDGKFHLRTTEMDVEHVFHRATLTLLTITSGARGGTRVYLNGKLAQVNSGYRLTTSDFAGRLIIGTSPYSYDTWTGEMRGVAAFPRELDQNEVREHLAEWRQSGRLKNAAPGDVIGSYAFEERAGKVVRNQVPGGTELNIPEHFQIPLKEMLTPPWKEITPPAIYAADIARNIAGFIPLGALFYLYFLRGHARGQAAGLTILLGGTTSLLIEILQAFIPQRVSGMTDLITNTLGTCMGVWLLQPQAIRVMLEKVGILTITSHGAIAEK
jgi:hypothetical protein